MSHKLINTPAELDQAITETLSTEDNLVLRDAEGCTWEFDPDSARHQPEGGWAAGVDPRDFPFLVLWWPGSVVVVEGSYASGILRARAIAP